MLVGEVAKSGALPPMSIDAQQIEGGVYHFHDE